MTIKEIMAQCEFAMHEVLYPYLNLENGNLKTSLSAIETNGLRQTLKQILMHYDEKHPFALDREEHSEGGMSLYGGYGNDGPIVETITHIIEELDDTVNEVEKKL